MKNYKIFLLIQLLVAMSLFSCSSDDEEPIQTGEEKDYTEVFIERLTTLVDDIKTLRDEATFGEKAGMYPEGSEEILDTEITKLENHLTSLKDGSKKIRPSDMDRIIDEANNSKSKFRTTMRTEDFIAIPAELYVNGKNGGYIDFGIHHEYSNFGEQGKQAFTVELWMKFESFGSFDHILTNFIDGQDNPRLRKGWGINYYNEASNKLLRMTYPIGDYDLFEPGIEFEDVGQWVHIAIVTNEPMTDDDDPHFFKMYINGNLAKKENHGRGNSYTSNDEPTSMLGFIYANYDGSIGEFRKGTVGYMKHIHIWKEAKTQAEIQSIMNDPESVTKDSPNLVCGWTFNRTVSNENAIKDITGKFSAKLLGDYQWRTNP